MGYRETYKITLATVDRHFVSPLRAQTLLLPHMPIERHAEAAVEQIEVRPHLFPSPVEWAEISKRLPDYCIKVAWEGDPSNLPADEPTPFGAHFYLNGKCVVWFSHEPDVKWGLGVLA